MAVVSGQPRYAYTCDALRVCQVYSIICMMTIQINYIGTIIYTVI